MDQAICRCVELRDSLHICMSEAFVLYEISISNVLEICNSLLCVRIIASRFFVGVRSHHLFSRTVSRRCVARRVKGSSIDPHTDLFIVSFGARRINFYIACKARRAWTAPCRICVLGKGAQRKSFVGSVGPLWFVVSNKISSDASKIRFFVPRRRHNPLEFSVSR